MHINICKVFDFTVLDSLCIFLDLTKMFLTVTFLSWWNRSATKEGVSRTCYEIRYAHLFISESKTQWNCFHLKFSLTTGLSSWHFLVLFVIVEARWGFVLCVKCHRVPDGLNKYNFENHNEINYPSPLKVSHKLLFNLLVQWKR